MANNRAARRQPSSRQPDIAEAKLDSACAAVLKSAAGREVFDWLKATLINQILGPDATPDELRYREGARSVVAMVQMRAHRSTQR